MNKAAYLRVRCFFAIEALEQGGVVPIWFYAYFGTNDFREKWYSNRFYA